LGACSRRRIAGDPLCVDLPHSPRRRATTALCAFRPKTGVDAKRTAGFGRIAPEIASLRLPGRLSSQWLLLESEPRVHGVLPMCRTFFVALLLFSTLAIPSRSEEAASGRSSVKSVASWKTWTISSGQELRLAPPPDSQATLAEASRRARGRPRPHRLLGCRSAILPMG
jgi:hypothetical protein